MIWYFVMRLPENEWIDDQPTFEIQKLNESGQAVSSVQITQSTVSVKIDGTIVPTPVISATLNKTTNSGQYVDDSGCILDYMGNRIK